MDLETVIYEKRGRVAYVTLNRPARFNAISAQMETELRQVWRDFEEDDEHWVAVVTGAGDKAFCAGADLKDLSERQARGEETTGHFDGPRVRMMEEGFKPSPAMNGVSKPVIAAVNGVCAGGGLHFMAECDFAIASENASFTDPHVSFGLVSAVETIGLSRRMPPGVVMRMALMGRHERLSAQRAYEVGLVTEVVDQRELATTAERLANAIAENAPYAVRQTKRAILGGLEHSLATAIRLGWHIVEETNRSVDSVAGPRAFAEGKTPDWQLR